MLAARARALASTGAGRSQAAPRTAPSTRRRAAGVAALAGGQSQRRRRPRSPVAAARAMNTNNNDDSGNPQNTIDPLALISRAPAVLAEAAAAADPVLGAAAREPAAFLGGAFAALLQLDDSRDPLREWIERTREAAGLPPTDALDYGDDDDDE